MSQPRTLPTTTPPPPLDPEHLPDDPAALKALIVELLATLHGSQRELEQVRQRLDQLLRRLYGPRAERFVPGQGFLFAELESQAVTPAEPPPAVEGTPTPPTHTARRGHGRQRLPANLPRVTCVHDLTVPERSCPCCGQQRVCIGQQTSEQLDYQPASLFVVQHVRRTYVCQRCLAQPEPAPPPVAPQTLALVDTPVSLNDLFATASLPPQVVPRGLAGPGLLAHLIVSKFVDHLPLYRLEKVFARHGVHLARSSLSDWLAQAADALQPLYDLLGQRVLRSQVLHLDDTHLPVLEPGRGQTRRGCVWVYVGDHTQPYQVYVYQAQRNQDDVLARLSGWHGYLQADAANLYDRLFTDGRRYEVGCWAHVRRKFHEARTSDAARSAYVLGVISRLYALEDAVDRLSETASRNRAADWELRRCWRQTEAVPLLTGLCQWLEQEQAQVLPKSLIGLAIAYALNQWQALQRYTTAGFLSPDNNTAERALRGLAVGRKNYLFVGADAGGATAAVLYSLTQSCQRVGVEPFAYLRDVLTCLPTWPLERLAELLPDQWAARQQLLFWTTGPPARS